MDNNIFKRLFLKSEDVEIKSENIEKEIIKTKNELDMIRANFNTVHDDTLIEMYIYSLKATEAKYKYLLTLIRKDREEKENLA